MKKLIVAFTLLFYLIRGLRKVDITEYNLVVLVILVILVIVDILVKSSCNFVPFSDRACSVPTLTVLK